MLCTGKTFPFLAWPEGGWACSLGGEAGGDEPSQPRRQFYLGLFLSSHFKAVGATYDYHRGAPPQRCSTNKHSRFDTAAWTTQRKASGTGMPADGPRGPPCRPHGDGVAPPGGRARARLCNGDGHGRGSLALGGRHRWWPLLRGGVGGELLPWQHYRAWPSRALSTSEARRGGPEATGASIGGTRGNGFKLNLDDSLWRNLLRRGRWGPGTGCPQKLVGAPSLGALKAGLVGALGSFSWWGGQGVGHGWALRPFPAQLFYGTEDLRFTKNFWSLLKLSAFNSYFIIPTMEQELIQDLLEQDC